MKKLISLAVLTALVAACADTKNTNGMYGGEFGEESLVEEQSLNDTYLMAAAPRYYVGSPYRVEEVQYIPSEDLGYNQTGIAGIIPSELNGVKTSNGETYDMTQMVATSKTLPLPTIARVTNVENGQSVVVRINNRGPFVNTRIVDLSPAAASRIGLTNLAKVQIQVLPEQTLAVKKATLGEVAQPVVKEESVVNEEPIVAEPVTTSATGNYSVQVGAFYAEDSANTLVQKMRKYGDATVVKEGDMYKVRIVNMDAAKARSVIDNLRSNEGMMPGLLKDGRWVNADSI